MYLNESFKYFGKYAQYTLGLKLEVLFLSPMPLSIGERVAILAAIENVLDRLSLTVFVGGSNKIFVISFTSFGCILSAPVAFLISICLRVAIKDLYLSET